MIGGATRMEKNAANSATPKLTSTESIVLLPKGFENFGFDLKIALIELGTLAVLPHIQQHDSRAEYR